jgi:hypothetical protein
MHNYEKKLMQLDWQGKIPYQPGKQYSMSIRHDSWCQVYLGKDCNCDPDIAYTEVTIRNRAEIAAEVAKDTSEIQFITGTDSRWNGQRHRRSESRE